MFRIMHRNYGQGEDDFIFNHRQQIDFTEVVNLNRFIRFRQCFSLFVGTDRTKTICCVNLMGKRLAATLAFEGHRHFRITSYNREALVVDGERNGAFHITVHTDYRFGDTLNLIGQIDALIIKAFLSRANRIESQG